VLEVRDVDKPYRNNSVARPELVSAQHTHCMIDAIHKSILASPIGDRDAHFIISDSDPA
jgi:hypothetical protein